MLLSFRDTGDDGLTDAALGGITFPEDVTVQPLGSPEIAVTAELTAVTKLAVGVPTQGQTLGVTKVEVVSLCVPESKGIGALLDEEEVTEGAGPVDAGVFEPPLPLIVPPEDLIDSHVPSVPE